MTTAIQADAAATATQAIPPVSTEKVVTAHEVSAGMWMLDSETGRWGEVLDAHHGSADWSINAWQVDLSDIGRVWVELGESVTVRIPAPVPATSTATGAMPS